MLSFKKTLLIALLPLLSFIAVHKFYVSVTQINYSDNEKALQITSRIFIDDFENLLKERYAIDPKLASKNELKNIDDYIEKYLKRQLTIKINGKEVTLNYLGKEYENDVVKCYIEVKGVNMAHVKSIEVQNTILFEMFEDQNNIVHFKINDLRKSFSLIKENDKGLLNF